MLTIIPPAPVVQGSITLHHYNTDKVQGLFYGLILPYQDNEYTVGSSYHMINKEHPALLHVATLMKVTAFDFYKVSDGMAYMCEGVSATALRHLIINMYGPEVAKKQLGLFVFKNYDKYLYQQFITKPFKKVTEIKA